MEVILLERVRRLGAVGDIVKVKDGYGRNYLLPQKKALRATKENRTYFEARRTEIEQRNAEKKGEAEQQVGKVQDTFVTLLQQAGEDGRLFGSVRSVDIARSLSEETGVPVSHTMIALSSPIKEIGIHLVKVFLHPEVEARVYVNVARSKDEAEEAKREFLSPQKKKSAKDIKAEAEAVEGAEETQAGLAESVQETEGNA